MIFSQLNIVSFAILEKVCFHICYVIIEFDIALKQLLFLS